MLAAADLVIRSLAVRRSGRQVLHQVDLTVRPGVTVVLGPNGAGKSTLFGAIAGLIDRSGGTVEAGEAWEPARVGFVPQGTEMPGSVTLGTLLEYVAWLRKIPRHDRRTAAVEALEMVRLADRAGDRVGALSGGMRRRAQLAMALIDRPPALVCDEPSVGLDPQEQANLRTIIGEYGEGASVLLSTHIIDEAAVLADHLVVLSAGRVAFEGSLDEFVGGTDTADRTRRLEQAYMRLVADGATGTAW